LAGLLRLPSANTTGRDRGRRKIDEIPALIVLLLAAVTLVTGCEIGERGRDSSLSHPTTRFGNQLAVTQVSAVTPGLTNEYTGS
jgi:hypothetical protein